MYCLVYQYITEDLETYHVEITQTLNQGSHYIMKWTLKTWCLREFLLICCQVDAHGVTDAKYQLL